MKKTTLIDALKLFGSSIEIAGEFSGAAVDTRLLKPGNLFFALKGERVDGHQFVDKAFELGASAAVVDRNYFNSHSNRLLIPVDDPLDALQQLAKKMVEQSQAKVIAVTGSVGKTTTKDFITHLLAEKYQVASSPGNSNSQIGLPLAILNHTTGKEDVLVIEMGMTNPGEISKLVSIAPPDVAVITKVALVHAVNFNSLFDIARAKAEIFSHPKTTMGVIDCDICHFEDLFVHSKCPKCTFGAKGSDADYTYSIENESLSIMRDVVEVARMDKLPFMGNHNVHNFLAAAIVAFQWGLNWQEISERAKTLKLPENRLQIVEKKGVLFVNDSYNASPISVKAALHSLPSPKEGGKTVAVIGEMLELGDFSESSHCSIAKEALEHVDIMICLGKECLPIVDYWKSACRPVFIFFEYSEIVYLLKKMVQTGDVVLLKGSRAKTLWKVLEEF